jgi:hypothetical protein
VRKTKKKVSITGIGGGTIVATRVSDLDGFGEYYHPQSVANILSFHDLASKHDIKYHGEENLFRVTIECMRFSFFTLHFHSSRPKSEKSKSVLTSSNLFSRLKRKGMILNFHSSLKNNYGINFKETSS